MPVDMAQIKKYCLLSKYRLHTAPITMAARLPNVARIDVLANNLLHWLFGLVSITSICVTWLRATKKNPEIGEMA
jgi:hypothetical protein